MGEPSERELADMFSRAGWVLVRRGVDKSPERWRWRVSSETFGVLHSFDYLGQVAMFWEQCYRRLVLLRARARVIAGCYVDGVDEEQEAISAWLAGDAPLPQAVLVILSRLPAPKVPRTWRGEARQMTLLPPPQCTDLPELVRDAIAVIQHERLAASAAPAFGPVQPRRVL